MASAEILVLEALARATSQQVAELKSAETQLAEWETKPGFYSILLRVIANHSVDPTVRWMAALTFKNGVDRYWRRSAPNAISEEEKKALREGLLGTIAEPINQVAVQLAVLIAKAARFDFPREWPELVPRLVDVVIKSEDPVPQHRALLILHHVIKTLASKRLAGDRRVFHDLTSHLYTFILNLSNSTMDNFFVQVQNNDPQCQGTLEKALLTLRIIRKLTIYGFKQPKDTPEVVAFVSSIFDRAKNFLHVRKTLENNGPLVEIIDKVIIHLTKVLLSLLEDHPFSFVPFMNSALTFAVSLLFTPSGEGLLFPRFIIQCLNLLKGALLCAEYKITKRPEGEEPLTDTIQGALIKQEFFQNEVLTEVCTKLISHYFLLTPDELELWDTDPEGFVNEDGGESWKYNLRPCVEALFLALFHSYRDVLSPVLLQLVYANHHPVPPHDLPTVLRKDAVYLAVGLGAFDLYDEIDMDKWFASLQQELTVRDGHYRIIRRRTAWLLGEWCGVKLSNQLRPALYRALMPLLQDDEDMVVRLTAANALKRAIDDFDFDSTQFMELLEAIFGLLFNLLREAKECETKMHVLTVLSFIVERTGVAIGPYSSALIQYLPLLWQESASHNMLRCAILTTLVHCVRALMAEHMTTYLYPVLAVCVDTTQEPHIYLLEDGLDLWFAMLENSSALCPEMLHLAKRMPPILADKYTEHLQPCCLILQAYVILSPTEFLREHGDTILACCYDLLNDVKPEGVATIFNLVETCIQAEPSTTIHLAMPIIQEVFVQIYNGSEYPMVLSTILSIMSRVLIHSMDIFCQIVESVAQSKGETAEVALDRILGTWMERMPLVTNNEKRKLLALALTSLMTTNSPVVLGKLAPLVRNVVETLNDITDLSETGEQVDSLVLNGQVQVDSGELITETEHERRVKKLGERDPVFTIELRRYLKSQMEELALRIGASTLESMLAVLGSETIEELKLYSS